MKPINFFELGTFYFGLPWYDNNYFVLEAGWKSMNFLKKLCLGLSHATQT